MSELEGKRRQHRLELFLGTTLFALLVNPLGALLSNLLLGEDSLRALMRDGVEKAAERYGFATGFAAPPIIIYALVALVVGRVVKPRPSLDAALRTGDIAFPLLALVGQTIAWKALDTDAQAALLFLFMPFHAAMAASVLVAVVFLFKWISSR